MAKKPTRLRFLLITKNPQLIYTLKKVLPWSSKYWVPSGNYYIGNIIYGIEFLQNWPFTEK